MRGQVRRGEKGSAILFWQFERRKLARGLEGRPVLEQEGKPVYETIPLGRLRSYAYTVFNAEQCDGSSYQTAMYEFGHWTGHSDRRDRTTLMKGTDEALASPQSARWTRPLCGTGCLAKGRFPGVVESVG